MQRWHHLTTLKHQQKCCQSHCRFYDFPMGWLNVKQGLIRINTDGAHVDEKYPQMDQASASGTGGVGCGVRVGVGVGVRGGGGGGAWGWGWGWVRGWGGGGGGVLWLYHCNLMLQIYSWFHLFRDIRWMYICIFYIAKPSCELILTQN